MPDLLSLTHFLPNLERSRQKSNLAHDILEELMKRIMRLSIIIAIGMTLAVALSSAALTRSAQTSSLGDGAVLLQATTTPQPEEGVSEVGSTDGIAAMGFVIVIIALIPILLRRRSWMQSQ